MPEPLELNVRNLRFRDNPAVFNKSASWLDQHRDTAVPALIVALGERGPEAIGIARVLGKFDDERAVPVLEQTLAAPQDQLAFEAARALAQISAPSASEALRSGLESESPGVVKNALRGSEIRKDPALCEGIRRHIQEHGEYAERALAACCDG